MWATFSGNTRTHFDTTIPKIETTSAISRLFHSVRKSDLRLRSRTSRHRGLTDGGEEHNRIDLCNDWIFSSASNVHVALDRSAFKSYVPFSSYALTVARNRQVAVVGIGSVELRIRRKSWSRQCHTITLENVLHIPGWICNVFSSMYFEKWNEEIEHIWHPEGVQFMQRSEGEKFRSWGFTEEFCGLDRLVLARDVRGRSPMMEDLHREVFSVNLNWPQGQRDRWDALVKKDQERDSAGHSEDFFDEDIRGVQQSPSSVF